MCYQLFSNKCTCLGWKTWSAAFLLPGFLVNWIIITILIIKWNTSLGAILTNQSDRWLPNHNHSISFPNRHQHGHLGLSIITVIEMFDSLNILVILPIMVSLISLVITCHHGNQCPLGHLDQLSQGGYGLLHLGRHLRLPHLLLVHTGQISKLKVCSHWWLFTVSCPFSMSYSTQIFF